MHVFDRLSDLGMRIRAEKLRPRVVRRADRKDRSTHTVLVAPCFLVSRGRDVTTECARAHSPRRTRWTRSRSTRSCTGGQQPNQPEEPWHLSRQAVLPKSRTHQSHFASVSVLPHLTGGLCDPSPSRAIGFSRKGCMGILLTRLQSAKDLQIRLAAAELIARSLTKPSVDSQL